MPSSTAEILKTELIDKLRERVQRRAAIEGFDPADAERFIQACYHTVAPDDILEEEQDNLLGAALALWELGARRPPGEPLVRVYNPSRNEDGWETHHTVVEVVNDDMPFLVDSVTAELSGRDHKVLKVVHPVVAVERDDDGRRQALVGERGGPRVRAESYMQIEIDPIPDPGALEVLRQAIAEVLVDVRAAVEDWQDMRAKLREIVAELLESPPEGLPDEEIEEARSFLLWLDDNHFTFIGYRELELVSQDDQEFLRLVPGSSLGVLRVREREGDRKLRPLSAKMSRFAQRPQILYVTKANHRATVHRRVYMDHVGVKSFDESGRVTGERRFVGLFTSMAYNREVREIPLLRTKVQHTLRRAGFPPDSHDGKALLHILETLPRDELFQVSERQLYDIAMGVLQLQERQRLALFVRRDAFERFVSCIVYVPRDRYDTRLRLRMQAELEAAFDGTVSAYYTQVQDSPLARVHYIVKTQPGEIPGYDVQAIETELARIARNWADALRETLVEDRPEDPRIELFERYREAWPVVYRDRFTIEDALHDIGEMEIVRATGGLGLHLYRRDGQGLDRLRLKLYHPGAPVALSDSLPLLENMGLRVLSEIPHEIRPEGESLGIWIHDFELARPDGQPMDLDQLRTVLPGAFVRVWRGEVDNDGFHRLVVRAGLSWSEVLVLRAYAKFMRQAGPTFSQAYMQETLAASPHLARLLVELFVTRFDPERREGVDERMHAIQERVREALEGVKSLDEDRILRRFLNLIKNTVRTSYFQAGDDGEPRPVLALKLESRRIKILPRPRPRFEIFVYSSRFEAVHLRGGRVARGGIRWSDRREDYRTEILQLMKAQMVKNAVIVPVGAKGGFVVKSAPGDRAAMLAEGQACYREMIRSMLSITDNLSGDEIVPPAGVVRHDEDDPYLVVAADKGTATFSDLANGVAIEHGFWLGDAFASGGSKGYDHKQMGITARGAWVAVQRHFRELDVDVQKEDFTAVGIGDMGGDVFGNGMLLSRHTKLVGAFNHLHVFVDPDPDPEASWLERKRLFDEVLGWDHYDEAVLSEGGAVYGRDVRSITVSPQVQALFDLPKRDVTPNQLVQALLRARVDLLWFGGIGTFIKAVDESDSAVGDRANDAVRVTADTVRCRVIGEGANLGITQRGRIELSMGAGRDKGKGVKLNTDAIDNSGGVDTSDHEVNIKILLDEAVEQGRLSTGDRDRLLMDMTDEVASLVLRHNYLQTQAISVTEAYGAAGLEPQARTMRALEDQDRLDRALEILPDDDEIAERQAQGRGLTRPELAVLLAYAKISLYEDLLHSDLIEDPLVAKDLLLYFPEPLRQTFRELVEGHRLRREIVATYATNSMVNRVGPSFVREMIHESGRAAADVARAYTVTREAYDLRDLWARIEALDYRVKAEVQIRMIQDTEVLLRRVTLWFLRHADDTRDITRLVNEFRPAVEALGADLESMLPSRFERPALKRRIKSYVDAGVPDELALRVASLRDLGAACDVWRIARRSSVRVEEVGRVYFAVGDRFRLAWLRRQALDLGGDDPWRRSAVASLVSELFDRQGTITQEVLALARGEADGEPAESVHARRAIEAWIATRAEAVHRLDATFGELPRAKDLAMLVVVQEQVRRLTGDG